MTVGASSGAICALVVVTLLLAGCGGADSRRASHMSRGQQFYVDGNLEKARVEFQNVLQIAPNDPEARYMSGRIAERLGDVRAAAGHYQGAIDNDPGHILAHANLGRMYVFGGAPERALEIVEPALKNAPQHPDLLTVRAAAKAQMKDPAGAFADAGKAYELARNNESTIALLASLYRQRGEDARAMQLLQDALQRLPNSVDLRQVVATMHAEAREPDAAIEQLRAIVKLKPAELSYRTQFAIYLARLGRVDEAEAVLREAVEIEERDGSDKNDAKLLYVEFLNTQDAGERGIRTLREFIARDPKDLDLQLGLGALQQRGGDIVSALTTYNGVIEQDEKGSKGLAARNRIAAIEAGRGDVDAALAIVAKVLERNPSDNDALALRGNIRLQQGDPAGAIADLRTVLRDQPSSVLLRRSLARAHLANGEPALAEENLRAAMEAAPADREARVDLAQLLVQSDRIEQGVTLLEETVRSAPDDVAAREALVRAYVASNDLDAARNAVEDFLVLQPGSAVGWQLAGVIAQAQGRNDEAKQSFERTLALKPAAVDAVAGLVRLDLARSDSAGALARVQAFLAKHGDNALALNLLGELHMSRREFAPAIARLSRAIELAPSWWMPHRNLALARVGAGDVPGATKALEGALMPTAYATPIVSDLGSLYERQRNVDATLRLYEEAYRRYPRNELLANNLAMLLVTYRKDPASLDRARDLTAGFANSNNGSFLDTYGWVRLKRGELAQALPALERAVMLSPESRVMRYHLAMAQKAAGQADRARENLERALKGTPNFAGSDQARLALQELARPARSAG